MAKQYKVLTDKLAGHKKGDVIDGPVHPALVGVHLQDVSEPEAFKCEACQNEPKATQKAKKQTYSSEALAEHYATEHPALAVPAGEEE